MKKILAIALALMLALGMLSALADASITNDDSTVKITMKYKAPNGGTNPVETFQFSTFSKVSIEQNLSATFPQTLPTIDTISFAAGEATADGSGTGTATATITLPTFEAVGIYKYSFNTITPDTKTAGVTYHDATTPLYLVVTVINDATTDTLRVAAVHCEGAASPGNYGEAPKSDTIEATYNAGTLQVGKTVTGNLGDKTKAFDVTVTFTPASGEAIQSAISYIGNSGSSYTTAATVPNTNSVTLSIKHGDVVTFTNIPANVTYTVTEADYTGATEGGYNAAEYSLNNATATTSLTDTISAGDNDVVNVINHKDNTIDTGITLDTLPYVVLLAVAALGAALLIIRRRRREED